MSRLSVIAIDQLAPMRVLETIDVEVVLGARMARLVALWRDRDPPAGAVYDVDSLEFDPIKINQEVASYFELMLRDRVNQAARAVTLAFAIGSDLDAIASRYPGGVPRLAGESDDRYRRRIWLSPNTLAPHGNEEAYVFWALTADPTLRDASAVTVEGTGDITITIVAEGDNPRPSQSQIIAVRAYILDQARKGLTDVIHVAGPIVVETDYSARVWLYPGPDADVLMATLHSAVDALIERQRWLGYDHTLLALSAVLGTNGVQNAKIDLPASDLAVDDRGLVKVNSVNLQYAGRAE